MSKTYSITTTGQDLSWPINPKTATDIDQAKADLVAQLHQRGHTCRRHPESDSKDTESWVFEMTEDQLDQVMLKYVPNWMQIK